MSANTTISPVAVPNMCKCGHDFLQHVPGTTATATCNGCGGHFHQFTSMNETEPSYAFQDNRPNGYVASGGLGTYQPAKTTTVGVANTAGATTITVASTVGAVVGGVATIGSGPTNSEDYEIIAVLTAGTFQIPTPGLTFTYAAGQNVSFFGRRGSMMGPGMPANGQRAG